MDAIAFLANRMDETPSMSFYTNLRFTHRRLIGHLQSVYHVKSVDKCFHNCLDCHEGRKRCVCASFNVEHVANGKFRLCEINTVSTANSPQDLVTNKGFQHYAVDSSGVLV